MIIKDCDKNSLNNLANTLGLKNVPPNQLQQSIIDALNINAILCNESPINDSTDFEKSLITTPKWIKELRVWQIPEDIIKKLVEGGIVSKEDINLFQLEDFVYCGVPRAMAVKLYRRYHPATTTPRVTPDSNHAATSISDPLVSTSDASKDGVKVMNLQTPGVFIRKPITPTSYLADKGIANQSNSNYPAKTQRGSDEDIVRNFDPANDDIEDYLIYFRKKMNEIDPTKVEWVPKLFAKLQGKPRDVAELALNNNCCINFEELVQTIFLSLDIKSKAEKSGPDAKSSKSNSKPSSSNDSIRKAHAVIEGLIFNSRNTDPEKFCDKLADCISKASGKKLEDSLISFCIYLRLPQNYQQALRKEAHMGVNALKQAFSKTYQTLNAKQLKKAAQKAKKANAVANIQEVSPRFKSLSNPKSSVAPRFLASPPNGIPISEIFSRDKLVSGLEFSFTDLVQVGSPRK